MGAVARHVEGEAASQVEAGALQALLQFIGTASEFDGLLGALEGEGRADAA